MSADRSHTIGEVARRHGLTLRALRFYEDKGLISPQRVGTARLYSDNDDWRARIIAEWSRAGISIEHIRELLRLKDAEKYAELRERITLLLDAIEAKLNRQRVAVHDVRLNWNCEAAA